MNFDNWTFRRTRAPAEPDTDSSGAANTPPRTDILVTRRLPEWAFPAFALTAFAWTVMILYEDLNPKYIWVDSAVFRYVGKVILAGGMPYRDTFDHKGPLLYLIQAAGLRFGNYGLWALEFLSYLFTFVCLYKTARMIGCGRRTACASVFCSMFLLLAFEAGGNMSEGYALPFLSVSLYIFLRYFRDGTVTKRRLIVCGLSCAAVVLLRPNMAGLWVVMPLGVIFDCTRKKKTRELLPYTGWFLLGFCALALPILLWLYANGAFEDFIQDYWRFNFLYSSYRGSSLSQQLTATQELMRDCAPIILFSLGVLFYQSFVTRKLPDILCLLSFALNLYLMCFSGIAGINYTIILIPWSVCAFSMFFSAFPTVEKRQAVILSAMLILCCFFYGRHTEDLWGNPLQEPIVKIVKEYSDETDAIAVCGNMDGVYVLSNRRSVSKYSYQEPIMFLNEGERCMAMRKEYFRDVKNGNPKLIVLPKSFPAYDMMQDVMGQRYRLLETLDDTEIYLLSESDLSVKEDSST